MYSYIDINQLALLLGFSILYQVGSWEKTLTMDEMPAAYVQPELSVVPASEVKSTCEGDNCPYIEWWLYDIDYLYDQPERSASGDRRTTSLFVNMYINYLGDGKCTGEQ